MQVRRSEVQYSRQAQVKIVLSIGCAYVERYTIVLYICPTLHPSYNCSINTSDHTRTWFQQLLAAVVPMNCMSDTQSIFKKLAYPTYNWRPVAHLPIGWMQSFEGRMHCICTGQMNNLRRSDAQHQQVGCTTFVGQMHTFCRSDAHILQVTWHMYGKMHTFHMSDACSIIIKQPQRSAQKLS